MKKIYSLFAVALFASATASALTPDNAGVYRLATAQDLEEFAALVNGGNNGASAVLVADINMEGVTHTPIGTPENPYKGTFDGRFFTIDNLVMNNEEASNLALFGYATSGAKFNNLILGKNCSITGKVDCAGFVSESVASVPGRIEFERCGFEGKVRTVGTTGYACAIIGTQADDIVYKYTGCYNTGTIQIDVDKATVGALSSKAPKATLRGCFTTTTIQRYKDSKYTNPAKVGYVIICGTTEADEDWTNNFFFGSKGDCYYPTLLGAADTSASVENPKPAEKNFGVYKVTDSVYMPTGKLCYYMNEGLEKTIWGQNLGLDDKPSFLPGKKLVVKNGEAFENSADVLPGLPDLPTAVEDIAADSKATGIYTIQGVKVNQANVPGIYIINGKKVVVK